MPALQGVLRVIMGLFVGLVVRLWVCSLRVRLELAPGIELDARRPRVFAFWHGQQMLLLAARRPRRAAVLVSWSRDGALQAGAMRALGFRVLRGSSSRAGASGLRALVRALRTGFDAALAIDGPRGPARRAKPGAAAAARASRAMLLPLGAHAARKLVLARAWDSFEVPLPLSRVVIYVGAPIEPDAQPIHLERAIDACRQRARALLVAPSTSEGPEACPP
jgi:hypothetical protein